MLFLIACASVALDLDVTVSDTATETVPYPACYVVCERLWTPFEECEQFYVREGGTVTVEECQDECGLAMTDSDNDGMLWVDEWPWTFEENIPNYGCESAAQRSGQTPCTKSNGCIDA